MGVDVKMLNAVVENLKDSLGEIKSIKKLDLNSVKQVATIIDEAVTEVERVSKEIRAFSSKEKRQLAVDAINQILDIPLIPEFVEGKVIGLVVDVVVGLLNKWFGKNWLVDKK